MTIKLQHFNFDSVKWTALSRRYSARDFFLDGNETDTQRLWTGFWCLEFCEIWWQFRWRNHYSSFRHFFNKKSSTKHQRPESKVFESPFECETSRSHTLILHTCFMELCKCIPVSDRFIRRFTISYQDLINTLRMNRDFVFHPILFSFILCFDSLIFISSVDFDLAAIDRVATKEFRKNQRFPGEWRICLEFRNLLLIPESLWLWETRNWLIFACDHKPIYANNFQ